MTKSIYRLGSSKRLIFNNNNYKFSWIKFYFTRVLSKVSLIRSYLESFIFYDLCALHNGLYMLICWVLLTSPFWISLLEVQYTYMVVNRCQKSAKNRERNHNWEDLYHRITRVSERSKFKFSRLVVGIFTVNLQHFHFWWLECGSLFAQFHRVQWESFTDVSILDSDTKVLTVLFGYSISTSVYRRNTSYIPVSDWNQNDSIQWFHSYPITRTQMNRVRTVASTINRSLNFVQEVNLIRFRIRK